MQTTSKLRAMVACLLAVGVGCSADDTAEPRTDDVLADPAWMETAEGDSPPVPAAPTPGAGAAGQAGANGSAGTAAAPATGAAGEAGSQDAGATTPSPDAGVDNGGDAGPAAPSSGCGVPWNADDAAEERSWRGGEPMLVARRELDVNGTQRRYLIAAPTDYDPNKPYPLVFGFHGLGGDREQLRGYMNVEIPAAGQALFIYPEGLFVERSGDTGWNTGPDSDDLLFVDALLTRYTAEFCVDEARIFAAGHSFGGCMSNAVGCFRGDAFRAIAPVAGCGPFNFRGGAACVGQVATLQIHSPLDTTTEYASGISGCTTWLRANHCDEMPACGCHWVESLEDPDDQCDQQAQASYDPGVAVEVMDDDDAPPVLREYLGCDPGYPVVFADHYNREDRDGRAERWHNPPPWAPAVIWHFFSTLPAAPSP